MVISNSLGEIYESSLHEALGIPMGKDTSSSTGMEDEGAGKWRTPVSPDKMLPNMPMEDMLNDIQLQEKRRRQNEAPPNYDIASGSNQQFVAGPQSTMSDATVVDEYQLQAPKEENLINPVSDEERKRFMPLLGSKDLGIGEAPESTKQSWHDYLFTGMGKGDRKSLFSDRVERLRKFGVNIPDSPTKEQVDSAVLEYKIETEKKLPIAIQRLFGLGGNERYKLWPERIARDIGTSVLEGITLPQDVMEGRVDPNSDEFFRRSLSLSSIAVLGMRPIKVALPELSPAHLKAIEDYAGAAYINLNKYLGGAKDLMYGIKPDNVSEITKQIKLLDAAIKYSPGLAKDTVVYRGTSLSNIPEWAAPGKIINLPTYTSTSTSSAIAEGFASSKYKPAYLQINIPKGFKALDVRKNLGATKDIGEEEILLPRNTFFKVRSVQDENYILDALFF